MKRLTIALFVLATLFALLISCNTMPVPEKRNVPHAAPPPPLAFETWDILVVDATAAEKIETLQVLRAAYDRDPLLLREFVKKIVFRPNNTDHHFDHPDPRVLVVAQHYHGDPTDKAYGTICVDRAVCNVNGSSITLMFHEFGHSLQTRRRLTVAGQQRLTAWITAVGKNAYDAKQYDANTQFPCHGILSKHGTLNADEDEAEWIFYCFVFLYDHDLLKRGVIPSHQIFPDPLAKLDLADAATLAKIALIEQDGLFMKDDLRLLREKYFTKKPAQPK